MEYAADVWSLQTAFLIAGALIAVVAAPILLFTLRAQATRMIWYFFVANFIPFSI